MNTEKIEILKIEKKDGLFLYGLYNENIIKNNFFSKKNISYSKHLIWLNHEIKSNAFNYKIKNKFDIGNIRFKKIGRKNFEISIAILNKYKKKGLAKFALKKVLSFEYFKDKKIYAKIKNNNLVSKKFFLKCGFKLNSHKTYIYYNK